MARGHQSDYYRGRKTNEEVEEEEQVIRHPFTLEHVANILSLRWKGAHLVEMWSQEKYVATLVFVIDNELRTFVVDVSPDGGTITERTAMRRARNNSIDVLKEVLDETVVMVTKHPDDRILTIWFESHHVHVELFSSGRGNIVLTKDGVIIDALRDRATRVNSKFSVTVFATEEPLTNTSITVSRMLATSTLRLGPHYAAEVCARCSIDGETLVGQLSSEQQQAVLEQTKTLTTECSAASSFLLLRRDDEVLFSCIPLSGWVVADSFSDILEAIRVTISERRKGQALKERRRATLKSLETDLRRVERSIEGMTSDAAREGRSERYRHWADLLLSQPSGNRSGLSSIAIDDEDGTPNVIQLNEHRTLIENARNYYDKARSSATASRSREERLPGLRAKRDALIASIEQVRQAPSLTELTKQRSAVTSEMPPSRDESNGRFRVFVIDDVHTLYVGKNAANNDELTMRFAKQNDWWFHARGSAGSHAILRGVEGEKIQKPILEKAAAITAYYSQARNASYVSVVYTQRKHVRKPKGANVGAVVLEREQTVMVKPWIPTTAGS
ncbi:MAG: DUF814 domain-containing protein [Ignavibacteria bacterium]|nr:DUF814 domain-containing protein [Ignavibacteria bacterium]